LIKASNKPLFGDWLVIIASIIAVIFLFKTLWSNEAASQLQIRQGDTIIGSYDLNQTREQQSPCRNQYCVHQGWLNRAGQVAICLPNQISLQLIGENKPYDSLNY